MANKTSKAAVAARRARSDRARNDFDGYGNSILLDEWEAAGVCGVSAHTLKFWRSTGKEKGPRAVHLHGMVRYQVGEIRRWRESISASTRDPVDQAQSAQ